MFNLVISIIAIALFSLALMAGMGYISFSKVLDMIESTNFEKKLYKIDLSITSYQSKFQSLPSNSDDLLKYIRNEFRGNESDLSDVIIFDNNIMINTTFNMLSGSNGFPVEICFGSDNLNSSRYDMLTELKNKVIKDEHQDKLTLSDTCGSLVKEVPAVFPATVWATYRIK
jgi:hypothetical protein